MMWKGCGMDQRHLRPKDRLADLLGLVQRHAQRFLAQHSFASLEGPNRIFGMKRWGQRDVYSVDLIGLTSRMQVGGGLRNSESVLPIPKLLRVPTGG